MNGKTKIRKRERHDALVDLTIGLIAEQGVAACTFRTLAELNGTTTRPFTYAFGSRAGLLAEVARESWLRLGFAPGDAPPPGDDPLGQLFDLCSKAVPVDGMDDPAMRAYAAVTCHAAEDPELRAALAEANAGGVRAYIALIEAAQAAGQIPTELDPEDLIAAIWALGDGLILAAISDPGYFTPERIRRTWTGAFNALVSG